MPEGKTVSAKDITEKDILALYDRILPLLIDNPEKVNPADALNKSVLDFIWYDFYHYLMDDMKGTPYLPDIPRPYYEQWAHADNTKEFSNISVYKGLHDDHSERFQKSLEFSYQNAIKYTREVAPSKPQEYFYYRIESDAYPKLVLGFFRYNDGNDTGDFSENDKEVFKMLTPHLLLLYRMINMHTLQSHTVQYFDSFLTICSHITGEYLLSNTESKLLPEILFGYSNEEIAERNFISLATVKSHVKHILKKTNTKSRMDFIGKFFTSPERADIQSNLQNHPKG